ncbi:hypothetical protein [Clostridium sp. HBUAS56010]|uniref:hypothetical protein n=1 Tax=Clostridium sp. HBUAS56010 TaxID=2571127 RepID=UPI00117807C0|nr:hypothetical protein [Clostridium sp. HBUAS56010]
MKYFILETEKEFCDAPILNKWKEEFPSSLVCIKNFYKIPERNIISISTNKDTIFPAIFISTYVMVSEMVKSVIDMYGDKVLAKDVVLVDSARGEIERYFLVVLSEVSGEMQTLGRKRSVVIERNAGIPLKDRNIFMLKLKERRKIIVNLDFAESILRRSAQGICLEEIELKEV